jgi:hypothetical protein
MSSSPAQFLGHLASRDTFVNRAVWVGAEDRAGAGPARRAGLDGSPRARMLLDLVGIGQRSGPAG